MLAALLALLGLAGGSAVTFFVMDGPRRPAAAVRRRVGHEPGEGSALPFLRQGGPPPRGGGVAPRAGARPGRGPPRPGRDGGAGEPGGRPGPGPAEGGSGPGPPGGRVRPAGRDLRRPGRREP